MKSQHVVSDDVSEEFINAKLKGLLNMHYQTFVPTCKHGYEFRH